MRPNADILRDIKGRLEGISDENLGKLLGGVSRTTISNWRGNEPLRMPLHDIFQLCIRRHWDFYEVVTGEPHPAATKAHRLREQIDTLLEMKSLLKEYRAELRQAQEGTTGRSLQCPMVDGDRLDSSRGK